MNEKLLKLFEEAVAALGESLEEFQKVPTTIQTVIFDKSKFDAGQCRDWLKEHDLKSSKIDETEDSFRFRQKSPDDFAPGSFRTIQLKPGIKAVIGKLTSSSNELDFKTPETHSIEGVEIFASGKWNGDAFTNKDLDQMVAAFQKTRDYVKPMLKLGHDKTQPLAKNGGMPAIGWVENLRRMGSKLVADFKHVPKKVYELIKTGAYRKVSAEIFLDFNVNGQRFPKLLKGVALLGADTPAVQTLKDIMNLYAADAQAANYDEDQETKIYEVDLIDSKEEDEEMDKIKELEGKIVELTQKLEEAQGQLKKFETEKAEETKKLTEENTELKSQIAKFVDETNRAKVEGDVNKLIDEKHITPAQKETAFTVLMDALNVPKEKKYSLDGKDVTAYEFHLAFMQKGTVNVNDKENSEAGKRQNAKGEEALIAEAKKYQEKAKAEGREVSFSEALIAVSPENESSSEGK